MTIEIIDGETWEITDKVKRLVRPPAEPSIPPLSHLEFRRRFTLAERVTIDNAANHPTLSDEQKATIKTLLTDLELASYVDLGDADVISGVQLMEAVGLIAVGRATQVLGGDNG